MYQFEMDSRTSAVYPGMNGSFRRSGWVYTPIQYVNGTPSPFIVVQDGQ